MSKKQPNVVLFFADTFTPEMPGCYGGDIPTPHIDRLAREGMRFTCAQPNSPVCSPARYNLLTGRDASRCGGFTDLYTENDPVFSRWNVYPKAGEETLATMYNANGYTTGLTGKWHLGEPVLEEYTDDDSRHNPASLEKVKRNYDRCRYWVKHVAGFNYVESLFTNNELAIPMPKDMTCEHNMHWISRGAVDFIGQNTDKPFFLMATPNLPHSPHVLDTLESGSTLTPAGFLDAVPDVQPSYENILQRTLALGFAEKPAFGSPEWLAKDRAAGVMWLDDGVGAVLKALDEKGLTDNTIFIFTTDHLGRGKMTCYRQYLPMIIRWPGHVGAGQETDALVSHTDLVATMADISGAAHTGAVGSDGKSFKTVLENPAAAWENTVFTEVAYHRGMFTKDWNYIATRFPGPVARHADEPLTNEGLERKHVRYHADQTFPGYFDKDQLYHHTADPEEQTNLAADPAHADRLREMKDMLRERMEQYPFSFGDIKPSSAVRPLVRRGQRTDLHRCASCGFVSFGQPEVSCPQCGAGEGSFSRQDDLLYAGEEKYAEKVEAQIPRITVESTEPLTIEISHPGHSTTAEDRIAYYDVYRDERFFKRFVFRPGEEPLAKIVFDERPESVIVMARSTAYGYFQRELLL